MDSTNDLDQKINDELTNYAYDFDYKMHGYMLSKFEQYGFGEIALELGAYQGAFTERLLNFFNSVVAVEGAKTLSGALKQRFRENNVEIISETFEELELDSKFDSIFLTHTLEHIREPIALLEKIKSWLSPEGKLFLACPNANAASRQIAVNMGLIDYNSAVTDAESLHGHYRTYSLDMLEYEARRAGLKVVGRGGIFFKPLANFQLDKALEVGVIEEKFLDGCFALGDKYPDLCSSIYLVCSRN